METERPLGIGPLGWAIVCCILITAFVYASSARAQSSHQYVDALCPSPDKVETKLGYRGFKHCELHEMYQEAFKNWNCKCYSGQCRPTSFRRASVTASNTTGYEIYVDGSWFPIPEEALRIERTTMTPELLEWEAHVCSSPRPDPHIECAWLNLPS